MATSEIARLSADLRGAGHEAGAQARVVVRSTAAQLEAHAKTRAPVDTGFLQSSIGTTITGNQHTTQAVIGPTAHYGPYLEYGTYRMPPQPYMAPALEAVTPGFVAAMEAIGAATLTS